MATEPQILFPFGKRQSSGLRIARSAHGLKRWFPESRVDHIDKVLFELLRQKRVRRETEETGEAWYFNASTIREKILERERVV